MVSVSLLIARWCCCCCWYECLILNWISNHNSHTISNEMNIHFCPGDSVCLCFSFLVASTACVCVCVELMRFFFRLSRSCYWCVSCVYFVPSSENFYLLIFKNPKRMFMRSQISIIWALAFSHSRHTFTQIFGLWSCVHGLQAAHNAQRRNV